MNGILVVIGYLVGGVYAVGTFFAFLTIDDFHANDKVTNLPLAYGENALWAFLSISIVYLTSRLISGPQKFKNTEKIITGVALAFGSYATIRALVDGGLHWTILIPSIPTFVGVALWLTANRKGQNQSVVTTPASAPR